MNCLILGSLHNRGPLCITFLLFAHIHSFIHILFFFGVVSTEVGAVWAFGRRQSTELHLFLTLFQITFQY